MNTGTAKHMLEHCTSRLKAQTSIAGRLMCLDCIILNFFLEQVHCIQIVKSLNVLGSLPNHHKCFLGANLNSHSIRSVKSTGPTHMQMPAAITRPCSLWLIGTTCRTIELNHCFSFLVNLWC